jgi:hypothetical protein
MYEQFATTTQDMSEHLLSTETPHQAIAELIHRELPKGRFRYVSRG